MIAFLFYQASLLTLASIKAKLLMLTTSKIPLKILSKTGYPFSFSPNNENFNFKGKMTTTVFLFYPASLLISASRMEVWQRLKPLELALLISLKVGYPFLFSPFLQITTVIKDSPINKVSKNKNVPKSKKLSFGFGFGFLTYSFSKSPKYVKTSTNKIPNPLLISLSSSYLNFPILNMTSHGGNRWFLGYWNIDYL